MNPNNETDKNKSLSATGNPQDNNQLSQKVLNRLKLAQEQKLRSEEDKSELKFVMLEESKNKDKDEDSIKKTN